MQEKTYIGGITYNLQTQADYLALSYNSSGSLLWDYSWNNIDLNDGISKIDYSAGKLALAGGTQITQITQITQNKWKYAIVHLNSNTGLFENQKISGGTGDGIDKVTDLAKDADGNVYVTGGVVNQATGYDFKTIKLNTNLNVVWSKTYGSSDNLDDVANALAVDNNGNVYVTGYSDSGDNLTNYTTVKYNSSGLEQWVKTYNGKANAADTAKAIVLDANNQPIITGVSENTGNEDFRTIKYGADGTELWNITYNGLANVRDNPFDIAVDNNGDITVAGQSNIGGSYRYTTVKYKERNIVNPPDEEVIPSTSYFTENNGQLVKINGQHASEVKYIAGADYPKVYIQDDKLSYVLAAVDLLADDTIHRIDMSFSRTNKNPKIRGLNKMDFYQNYYLPSVPDGKHERVESFKKLVNIDIWDDIDLMVSHNNKGLKYYFICEPGVSSSDIGWAYNGATSVSVNGVGDLVLESSIGEVIMPQGEAYEVTSSGVRINKSWQPSFLVSGSDVTLGLGAFNSSNTLIIEIDKGVAGAGGGAGANENMLWNSHYGSSSESHFNDVVTDSSGEIYICGETEEGDFPTLPGQQVLGEYTDGTDVLVLNLSADVVPQWTTFFGGSENANGFAGNDIARGIALRRFVQDAVLNDIYICGYTNSIDMAIETGGVTVDDSNGCTDGVCLDGFVAQFDLNGILNWSTYIGEDGDETLRDIEVDNLGNIYAVGSRNSNTNPVTKSGASNYTSGSGLIIQFDVNRNLVWSNPWDGEIIMGIAIDGDNNVYTTGGTKSQNMPVLNTDPSFPSTSSLSTSDELDAFINKFSPSGQLEFSSYFGASCEETGNSVVVDNNDNVYFAGNNKALVTSASCGNSIPLVNEISQSSPSNWVDFLVKLNLSNVSADILFSSYLGGSGMDGFFEPGLNEPFEELKVKLAISNSGILFLTTYSRSQYSGNYIGMPLPFNQPSGYYVKNNLTESSSTSGNPPGDNYIAAFDQEMDLIWATYHGSDKYDYPGGIAISENNDRLIVVGTGNQGVTEMDVESFEAEEYDEIGSEDYYQPVPVSITKPCGQGVIFGVEGLGTPLSNGEYISNKNSVKVWPNPSQEKVYISYSKIIDKIEIYDMNGRKVKELNLKSRTFSLDVSDLSSGVFLIKAFVESGIIPEKFLKL